MERRTSHKETTITLMDDGSLDGWGRREPLIDNFTASSTMYIRRSGENPLPVDHVLAGYDGCPKGEINAMYTKKGLRLDDHWYTIFENKNPQHLLFTAIFTCPFEGEHFASGNWGPVENIVKVGDTYWYKKKKQAKIAAAAKALDVMSLRRCQDNARQPHRRCRDEPYLLQKDAPEFQDVELPLKVQIHDYRDVPDFAPRKALNEWYQAFKSKLKQMGGTLTMDDPDKSCYVSWMNLLQGENMLFTSVFTCPLTGQRFPSGMLSGGTYVQDFMYYDSNQGELKFKQSVDGDVESEVNFYKIELIWYKTKKDAENAAAARAIDCLRHRDQILRESTENSRYCIEKPYLAEDAPELWKAVSSTVESIVQFKYDKRNGFVLYHEDWPRLPDSSELSDALLKSVFDDESDALMRAYLENRGVSNLESTDEDDHTWR